MNFEKLHFKMVHFGLAKLSTSIFLRLRIIRFKMESIFKMAILHLSILPSEPCDLAIFKPTIFKFLLLFKDYIRINDTFRFFDSFSISSDRGGSGPKSYGVKNSWNQN
jgi:hypothetical protein